MWEERRERGEKLLLYGPSSVSHKSSVKAGRTRELRDTEAGEMAEQQSSKEKLLVLK